MSAEKPRANGRKSTFGVEFDPMTFGHLLERIESAIRDRRQLIVGYLNMHGAHLYQASREFRGFIDRADIAYADGVPLMIWRRLVWRDCPSNQRFTLTHSVIDFMTFCRDRDWGVYYVGSEQKVLDDGMANIRAQVPGLKLSGHNGFFSKDPDSPECRSVIEAINASGAEVLMVGMGMPVQERWITENAERLRPSVIWAVGGAIEYYSGHVALAPAWMNRIGLEWAFRLSQRPARFAHRYLVEPFGLIPAALSDVGKRLRPDA